MGFFKEEDLSKYEKLSGVEIVNANGQTLIFCNAELKSKVNEKIEELTNMGIEIVSVNQTPPTANGFAYFSSATITWKRSQQQLDEIKKQKEENLNRAYSNACAMQSSGNYDIAQITFRRLPRDYKDVSARIDECDKKLREERERIEKENKKVTESAYVQAKLLIDAGEYHEAYKSLVIIMDRDKNYKDIKDLIKICSKNDTYAKEKEGEKKKLKRFLYSIPFVFIVLITAFILLSTEIISIGVYWAITAIGILPLLINGIIWQKVINKRKQENNSKNNE